MKKYVLIKYEVVAVVKAKELKNLKDYKVIAESDNKPTLIEFKKTIK